MHIPLSPQVCFPTPTLRPRRLHLLPRDFTLNRVAQHAEYQSMKTHYTQEEEEGGSETQLCFQPLITNHPNIATPISHAQAPLPNLAVRQRFPEPRYLLSGQRSPRKPVNPSENASSETLNIDQRGLGLASSGRLKKRPWTHMTKSFHFVLAKHRNDIEHKGKRLEGSLPRPHPVFSGILGTS
jgi:hypothetical protein